MSLLLSQKSSRILAKNFNRPLLNQLSQLHKALRLRGRGPQRARVALVVFVGNILLATAIRIAVDFFPGLNLQLGPTRTL
jgi:hypothetical protein